MKTPTPSFLLGHDSLMEKETSYKLFCLFFFLEQTYSIIILSFEVVPDLQKEVEPTLHSHRNLPSYRTFFAEVRINGSPHLLNAHNQNINSHAFAFTSSLPNASKKETNQNPTTSTRLALHLH